MPFDFGYNDNKQIWPSDTVEAAREQDCVRLIVAEQEYRVNLRLAKTICDLLSITVYGESIVGLMAKRRILTNENEELKEKLQNAFQYYRRKHRGATSWKKSQ